MELINGREASRETTIIGTVDLGAEVSKVGGIDKIATTDINTIQLLVGMLAELKKIEYHLAIATDTDLTNTDLGG